MNPEIKAEWLAALRSGEYNQAFSRLKGPGGSFCCLGVLCDLYVKKGVGEWFMYSQDNGWLYSYRNGIETSRVCLPDSIVEASGITTPTAHIPDSAKIPLMNILIESGWKSDPSRRTRLGDYHDLSSLNDLGLSFDKIADVIEVAF